MKQTLRQLAHWTLAVAAIVLFAGCKTKVANETKQVADETKQTAGETTQTEGETKAVASDPGPASTGALAEWPMWEVGRASGREGG